MWFYVRKQAIAVWCCLLAQAAGVHVAAADDKAASPLHFLPNGVMTIDASAEEKLKALAASERALAEKLAGQDAAAKVDADDSFGGPDPRGGDGACCDGFGDCFQTTASICQSLGGTFIAGATCTFDLCPQPVQCDLWGNDGFLFSYYTQMATLPGSTPPFQASPSDQNTNTIAMDFFDNSTGWTTHIRWWGFTSIGSTPCTRLNNDFEITIYQDADGPLNGATGPAARVVCQHIVTATRLPTVHNYGGLVLHEYTATIPRCTVAYDGWISIQAVSDGTTCQFRWISSNAFGPNDHDNQSRLNGQSVSYDLSLCLTTNDFSSPLGACCDDSNGTCVNDVYVLDCGANPVNLSARFGADQTCATLNPPCGQVTGACCDPAAGTCQVLTSAQCTTAYGGTGLWRGAFTDCSPNPCTGACCNTVDGTCTDATPQNCAAAGSDYQGDGTNCASTACAGTGRCCRDSGQTCDIRTQLSCTNLGGQWLAGQTCFTSPCPIPPTNDLCTNALDLPCNSTIVIDTTTATTSPDDPVYTCRVGGPLQGFNTVWFSFVASSSTAQVRTCGGAAPADDTLLAVYSGTCGSLVQIGCDDDACATPTLSSDVCVTGLVVGQTYLVQVSGWGATDIGAIPVQLVCPGETCAPTGSCCLASNGCAVLTESACLGQGGTYGGDSTTCQPAGACCLGIECVVTSQACCAAAQGSFLGDGTDCGEAAGNPQTYESPSNLGIGVVDDAYTGTLASMSSSTITVPSGAPSPIGDVIVELGMSHTWLGDLTIKLQSPSGTVVTLVSRAGFAEAADDGAGCCGDSSDLGPNNRVRFNDSVILSSETMGADAGAAAIIGLGTAFNGEFHTSGFQTTFSMSQFNGQNPVGDWTLYVGDGAGGDLGIIQNWALKLDSVGFNPCNPNPGACCFSEGIGDCQQLSAVDCADANGRFISVGAPCAGDVCVPRGACCNTITGACTQETEEACNALPNRSFLGDFTPCSQCPVVNGACCLPNETCIGNSTFDQCNASGGAFLPNVPCPEYQYLPESCANDFEDISATGNPLALTDDSGAVVPIGFDFVFWGVSHANIAVTSNGYLTFGGTLGAFTEAVIPSATVPNDLIAVLWDDFNPAVGGSVQYQTLGTAPNRRFIAQWTDVPQFSGGTGPVNTFQGVLFEGTNCIEFRYLNYDVPAGDYQAGVEDATGSLGTNVTSMVAIGACIELCPLLPNNPCQGEGACCNDGVCTAPVASVDCFATGGTFLGTGTTCAGNPCDDGACCNAAGDCAVVAQAQCAGQFQGFLTDCSPNPCRGACCVPSTGQCSEMTQAACNAAGGFYLGDASACGSGNTCPPLGGTCCLPGDTCVGELDFNACVQQGGAFVGIGIDCGATHSAGPGLGITIPDDGYAGSLETMINSAINVPDGAPIVAMSVEISMSHTYIGDLVMKLESPQGTRATLVSRAGLAEVGDDGAGCCGDSSNLAFANPIVFDDVFTLSSELMGADAPGTGDVIGRGTAFAYQFQSSGFGVSQELANFIGEDPVGDWRLYIGDSAGADLGTLDGWSITFHTGAGPCNINCTCTGDANSDGRRDGRDVPAFTAAVLSGLDCDCCDFTFDGQATVADVDGFVTSLLNSTGACP